MSAKFDHLQYEDAPLSGAEYTSDPDDDQGVSTYAASYSRQPYAGDPDDIYIPGFDDYQDMAAKPKRLVIDDEEINSLFSAAAHDDQGDRDGYGSYDEYVAHETESAQTAPILLTDTVLKGLNDRQVEAVSLPVASGSVMVLAGAGTGKTAVLTKRIAYLVAEGVSPKSILAVTFTNKAAREMRERLERMGVDIPPMGTFHQIGMRILKLCPEAAGVGRWFTPADQQDSESMFKKLFVAPKGHCIKAGDLMFHVKDPVWPRYRSALFGLKEAGIVTAQMVSKAEVPPGIDRDIIGQMMDKYEEHRKSSNKVDFADMIWGSLFAIKYTEEGREWAKKFTHILVDEFQDTSHLQFEWVHAILAHRFPERIEQNIFCVGDDCQSIYAFRGAVKDNVHKFVKGNRARVVMLEQNYRCLPDILNAANQLIKENEGGDIKKLWSDQEQPGTVKFLKFKTEEEEAKAIARSLSKKTADQHTHCAVLTRTRAALLPIAKALRDVGITCHVVGATDYFKSAAIRDAMALARFGGNNRDVVSFVRSAGLIKGIGKRSIEDLVTEHDKTGHSLLSLCRKSIRMTRVSDMFEGINMDSNPSTAVRLLIHDVGLLDAYEGENLSIEYLTQLIDMAGKFKTLGAFLEEVTISAERADEKLGVVLSTVHGAKGLEWDCVYLPALSQGHMPMLNNEEGGIEEERRLMYVAITRAKGELYTSYAQSRMVFGQCQNEDMSQFVIESGLSLRLQQNKSHTQDYHVNQYASQPG